MTLPDVVSDKPVQTIAAVVALTAAAVGAGLVLRAVTRRTRSLRHLVLAITIASLAIGAVAAVLLARLMVLDAGQVRTSVGVLATTAVFATVLALVASAPLGRDTRRLESTVSQLKAGDRTVRTGVHRADELGQVAQALDELTERLDALERERTTFEQERRAMLTSVGHDLRTPLSALRAAIEALADGVAPDPQRYLRAMTRDVEALSSLVDDLFLLASIESGRLVLSAETVDVSELADEAVEALNPAATARRVTLHLHSPGRAHGERQPHGHQPGDPQPRRQRHPPRSRGIDRRDRRRRADADGPGHRRGTRVPTGVLRARLRQLRSRRPEPDAHDGRRRARPGHRQGTGRGARWPHLDRAAAGRAGGLRAARRLTRWGSDDAQDRSAILRRHGSRLSGHGVNARLPERTEPAHHGSVNEERFDVRSADGTSLAVWVDGDGPALVMVHGSIADHTTFEPFVAVLEGHGHFAHRTDPPMVTDIVVRFMASLPASGEGSGD